MALVIEIFESVFGDYALFGFTATICVIAAAIAICVMLWDGRNTWRKEARKRLVSFGPLLGDELLEEVMRITNEVVPDANRSYLKERLRAVIKVRFDNKERDYELMLRRVAASGKSEVQP